jgi:hypothetical protein
MRIQVEPLLERCRVLYRIPPGPERFAAYIALTTETARTSSFLRSYP